MPVPVRDQADQVQVVPAFDDAADDQRTTAEDGIVAQGQVEELANPMRARGWGVSRDSVPFRSTMPDFYGSSSELNPAGSGCHGQCPSTSRMVVQAQERADENEEAEHSGILQSRLECHRLDDVAGNKQI